MYRRSALVVLPWLIFVLPAWADKKNAGSASPAPPRAAGRAGKNEAKANRPQATGADAHPGERALDRLENMTPAERAKALENLPPARRKELEQKLRTLDSVPPVRRAQLRNQLERFNSLPPRKQEQIRRSLWQFQQLPPLRREIVRGELDRLNSMPENARRARLKSQDFWSRYSPEERQMIERLSQMMPEDGLGRP